MTCKAVAKAPTKALANKKTSNVKPADDKITNKMQAIEHTINCIAKNTNKDIILLRNKEVIQWLFGDLSFMEDYLKEYKTKKAKTEQMKKSEDIWGKNILKTFRPDLDPKTNWTTVFGETIGVELYALLDKNATKPVKKERKQPDKETIDYIIEVKTQTYFTEGTAGEKILGTPFKYAEIPDLYGKPLKIVCIGGAEKICREDYGNLPGGNCSPQKKKILDLFKSMNIEYIGATDILKGLC